MTEETLQAAILRLKSQALERFAIIKDLYHRPTTPETVEQISQHALAMAQLEGAMVTLQQYAPDLANQTVAEAESNLPEQPEEPPAEQPEESPVDEPEKDYISEEVLEKKSRSFRDSQKYRKNKKAKK